MVKEKVMDWGELNSELVLLIANKLGDVLNFVRFRAVCKNWRLAVGTSDLPPQLPWYFDTLEHRETQKLRIFSLYSNKMCNLHIPQLRTSKRNLLIPSSGYILVADDSNSSMSLFNPLTGSYIPLNGICSNEFYDLKTRDSTPEDVIPIYIGPSHDPSENGDIVVLCVLGDDDHKDLVSFWRFDERRVTRILELPPPNNEIMAYFKGRLFVSMDNKETRVIDVATGEEAFIIPNPGGVFDYLIEACGVLLGVLHLTHMEEKKFEVYQLEDDDDGKNPRWVETSDIGDRILFLSYDCYGLYTALCLKASDFEGFTGNCIYFTTFWDDDIHRYDLRNKELEVIPVGMSGNTCILFVPSLS